MTVAEKREASRQLANEKRIAVAQMRTHIRAGRVDLATLFREPPAMLQHLALVDLMALARTDTRNAEWRINVGKAALRDGVNVLMPVGRASLVSREWAAVWSPRVNRGVVARRREVERVARVAAAAWEAAA